MNVGTRNNLKGIFSIRILSGEKGLFSAVPSDGLPAVSGGAGAAPFDILIPAL